MSRRILARLLLVNQMLHTSISIAVHNMLLYSTVASQCFAARTSAIFVHGMVWCRVPTIPKLHDEH